MKPELYQQVMLIDDVPQAALQRGDLAVLLEYVPHPRGGEEGVVLEVFNILGESLRVVTVPVSAIGVLQADYLPVVRPLLSA
ncbi:MAG TPA: hypothetical protein PLQ56_04200 [Aggregatilineales bacterium]|nr:hypothetical protein [Aggregatilineales bacterium]